MKLKLRVVLVEPEYEINLGAVCRVMKNFGCKELYLINPKADKDGFDAVMFSKHAKDILEKAKVCSSLEEATAGCEFTIGTSGILQRHRHTLRNPISLPDFTKKLTKRGRAGMLAILFGREGIGLSEGEIDKCDFLITIPTSQSYPVMNMSHSVAVVLYELSKIRIKTMDAAGKQEKEHLQMEFDKLVQRYISEFRNPRKVKVAFKRVFGRSMISDKECAALLGTLRKVNRELEERKKT